MYNVLIYYFVYPILAPCIIFLSNSCAEVTSLETTKALNGCCPCEANTSANWSEVLCPTILKAGACDAGAFGEVGVGTLTPPLGIADFALPTAEVIEATTPAA